MKARGRGFTLIELLVVMMIIGALLATVPAAFNKAVPGAELKDAARRVATGLRAARNAAISYNQEASFDLNLDARNFTLNLPKGRAQVYSLPHNEAIQLKLFTAETELSEDYQGGAIRFFPDGSSTGGQVSLALNQRKYIIDINWLTGRVSIFD